MYMLKKNNEVTMDSIDENLDDSGYEDAIYMYELPGTGLFESTKIIEGLEFVSFDSLNKELDNQYGIISFDEDQEDDEMLVLNTKLKEVIAKDKFKWIVCKEGVYGWDLNKFEYNYYGEFSRNTKRIKLVQIPEDRILYQGGTAILIRKGHYQILHEELKTISSEVQIEVFTIKQNYTGEFIELPNCPGIFHTYESDLLLNDFDIE